MQLHPFQFILNQRDDYKSTWKRNFELSCEITFSVLAEHIVLMQEPI